MAKGRTGLWRVQLGEGGIQLKDMKKPPSLVVMVPEVWKQDVPKDGSESLSHNKNVEECANCYVTCSDDC